MKSLLSEYRSSKDHKVWIKSTRQFQKKGHLLPSRKRNQIVPQVLIQCDLLIIFRKIRGIWTRNKIRLGQTNITCRSVKLKKLIMLIELIPWICRIKIGQIHISWIGSSRFKITNWALVFLQYSASVLGCVQNSKVSISFFKIYRMAFRLLKIHRFCRVLPVK